MLHKKAFALSFTIWIVAILSLLAALYLNYGKSTVYKSGKLHDKLSLAIQAESTVELLKFYFATGKFVENRIENKLLSTSIPSLPSQMRIDSSTVTWGNNSLTLQDSAGLISLYDIDTIAKYLGHGTYQKYGIIKDSLQDWLDIDDFSNLNGAEASSYRQRGKPYLPRNAKYFTSFEELMLVNGIDDVNLTKVQALQRDLSISDKVQYNLFTLKPSVLQYKYKLSQSDIEQLTEIKEKGLEKFRLLFNSLNTTPLDFEVDSFYPSGIIHGTVTSFDTVLKEEIQFLIDFRVRQETQSFELLYYKD